MNLLAIGLGDIAWNLFLLIAIVVLIAFATTLLYIGYKIVKTVRRIKKTSKGLLSGEGNIEITTSEDDEDDGIEDEVNEAVGYAKKVTLDSDKKVYVMNIDGVIKYETEPKSNFQTWYKMLEKTIKDKPLGLIARVNSPGGTVGATQELYEILSLIRLMGIKVVVLMEDVAASGGLYLSMAADKIIANSGTITGSAGVIMQGVNYGKFLKRHDIEFTTIKAGERKDIMSPVRDMNLEEKTLLEHMAIDTQDQFLQCIRNRRKINEYQMDKISDARILTGTQALDVGLIDGIGGYQIALEVMHKLLGLSEKEMFKEVILKGAQTPLEKFLGKSLVQSKVPFLNKLEPMAEELSLRGPLWLMPR